MKHSKLTAIVLALCMLVTLMVIAPTAASATTTDANFVKDGSFEKWGITGEQGNWVCNNRGGQGSFTLSSEESYDGNYSMRFANYGTVTTKGSLGVYQMVDAFPEGTKLTFSLKYYAKKFSGSVNDTEEAAANDAYYRMRLWRDDTAQTTLLSTDPTIKTPSDGWKELSLSYTVNANTAPYGIYIGFEEYLCTDYEFYLDDFKVEVVTTKPALKNGDFESGELDPWTTTSTGGTPTVETDEKGNHYLKLDTLRQERARQTVNGLTAGKHYYVAFDIKTNGAHGHINVYPVKNSTLVGLNAYNTGGEWQRHAVEWTTASTDTTARIEFRLETAADATVTDEYVYIDNVVFGEIEDNALHNTGFEYGLNGMGLAANTPGLVGVAMGHWAQSNSDGYTATYTPVDGGMGGKKALKVVRPIADGIADKYTEIKQVNIPLTAGEKYVFTAYVKAGEDFVPVASSSACQFFIRISNSIGADGTKKNADAWPTTKLSAANGWTPLKMVFTAHSTEATTLQFRTYGTGTFYYSNFSIRKLDAPVIDYRGADGDISESLADGGKVTITMPITASAEADGETPAVVGDAGNIVALALYNKSGNNKTLRNIKVKTITAADETAGYASFELKADALGADFANVNYAKLIMLKGGSYDAIQEYDLLLKAAQ